MPRLEIIIDEYFSFFQIYSKKAYIIIFMIKKFKNTNFFLFVNRLIIIIIY